MLKLTSKSIYQDGRIEIKIGDVITYSPLDSFKPETSKITHIIKPISDSIRKSVFCMENGDVLSTIRMYAALEAMEYNRQTQD
jgi:hypothetical protein